MRKLLLLMLNAPLSVSPVPATMVYVKVLLASTSVVVSAPITVLAATFSATLVALNAISVGTSLTFVTVRVNTFSKLKPPWSVVLTLTL